MKPLLFAALVLFGSIQVNQAEIVTLLANDPKPPFNEGDKYRVGTLEITPEQTVELLSASIPPGFENLIAEKEGIKLVYRWQNGIFPPLILRGPAKLTLTASSQSGGAAATFRITPERVDPTKTLILLPGTNNAANVTLICSTNLTDWVEATNGVYSGNVAKFFRIGLEPIDGKK